MNFYKLGIGTFELKIYGIFVAIAFIVAVLKFYRSVEKSSLSTDFFVHHFWKWMLAGILLGRIVALALYPEIIARHGVLAFFAFWEGEIHTIATGIGFLSAAFFDLRSRGEDFKKWLDLAVSPFLVAVILIDVGGFITGAVHGTETSMFWGIRYETFGVESLNPVHPVTLYAALAHTIVFRWARSRARIFEKIPGALALRVAIFYFSIDFFLQSFRGDPTIWIFGKVRLEQILDFVILAILFFAWRGRGKM